MTEDESTPEYIGICQRDSKPLGNDVGSVPVRIIGSKAPRDMPTSSKGGLGALLLFGNNGLQCLGGQKVKTICLKRLGCLEKRSILRRSVKHRCMFLTEVTNRLWWLGVSGIILTCNLAPSIVYRGS